MTPTLRLATELRTIPESRVRLFPTPGTATKADLHDPDGPVLERVAGTLVEKPMGWYASFLTTFLIRLVGDFVEDNLLGLILAPDAVLELLPNLDRAPDLSFVSYASLPGGVAPGRHDNVPAVVPDLAVEVLSDSNTPAEMKRKRGEYFRAGVKLVWIIDPDTRVATVYTADDDGTAVPAGGTLSGEPVLPGFTLHLGDLFARADRLERGGAPING